MERPRLRERRKMMETPDGLAKLKEMIEFLKKETF
jgi:hypothetical protein